MQEVVTITLSPEVKSSLDAVTREESRPLNALIEEAIREYLFFRRFHLLRERMIPKAQAQGINTDQDVFDLVS